MPHRSKITKKKLVTGSRGRLPAFGVSSSPPPPPPPQPSTALSSRVKAIKSATTKKKYAKHLNVSDFLSNRQNQYAAHLFRRQLSLLGSIFPFCCGFGLSPCLGKPDLQPPGFLLLRLIFRGSAGLSSLLPTVHEGGAYV